jgi:hypothetical protein
MKNYKASQAELVQELLNELNGLSILNPDTGNQVPLKIARNNREIIVSLRRHILATIILPREKPTTSSQKDYKSGNRNAKPYRKDIEYVVAMEKRCPLIFTKYPFVDQFLPFIMRKGKKIHFNYRFETQENTSVQAFYISTYYGSTVDSYKKHYQGYAWLLLEGSNLYKIVDIIKNNISKKYKIFNPADHPEVNML